MKSAVALVAAACILLACPAALGSSKIPAPSALPQLPLPHVREANNTTENQTDTSPPVITITSHEDNQAVKESRITVAGNVSDPGSGVQKVQVSLNGGDWIDASGNSTWSIGLALDEGRNTIVVRAADLSGNSAQKAISIIYSVSKSDSTGVLLAAAIIIPVIMLVALVSLRKPRAPPPQENGEEDLEKRLLKKTEIAKNAAPKRTTKKPNDE